MTKEATSNEYSRTQGFAELIKSIGTDPADGTIASETTRRFSEMFHLDNQWDDPEKAEREK